MLAAWLGAIHETNGLSTTVGGNALGTPAADCGREKKTFPVTKCGAPGVDVGAKIGTELKKGLRKLVDCGAIAEPRVKSYARNARHLMPDKEGGGARVIERWTALSCNWLNRVARDLTA